jgi:ComF family protein
VIKELIHQFKYKNREYLDKLLARLMIDFIKEYDLPMEIIDLVIPVPLYTSRLREREFNQALLLSKEIALEFKKKLVYDNLVRLRNTRTQTRLKDSERLLNVRNSFALAKEKDIKGKNILLIDDVLTTAATVSEAASALKHAGANVVFVLTLAN